MRSSRPIDISVLSSILAAHIDALCVELLPAGIREGNEYRIGSVAGEPGRSMAVHLGGSRSGVWSDFATGEAGDALDLVAAVLFRGDKGQAARWARTWLGIDTTDPASFEQRRREAVKRRERADQDNDRHRRRAEAIYFEAQPQLAGTAAATYLASRAIDFDQLGRQPRALRFHPRLWNKESQQFWPALVAAIVDGDGRMVAVHRTWLALDGSSKAPPLHNQKMTLGRYAGAAIHLWRGASGKPLNKAPDGDSLVITEGIEDGLSAAVAAPERRVMAAVSLGNMANILLPPAIRTIIIAAQNDAPGSRAARSLDRTVVTFKRQGRRVKIARPPSNVKDLNDLLRASISAV
jgi:hypothetical protein